MIYFAQAPDGGPIKIGSSVSPKRRTEEISESIKLRLEVIASCSGGEDEEKALHHRLCHARTLVFRGTNGGTEWFLPTESVAACVKSAGGEIRGSILRPFDESFCGRDGSKLLLGHLTRRGITQKQAAAEIPCSNQSINWWARGIVSPDEIGAEMLAVWSGGAVPKGAWLTRNGIVVALDFGPTRGRHDVRQKRLDRLAAMRPAHLKEVQ